MGGAGSGGSVSGGDGGAVVTSTLATGGAVGLGGAGGARPATTVPIDCSNLPAPPTLDSCVQPAGGWPDGPSYYTARSAKLSGTITAVAKGPMTGGCIQSSAGVTSDIVVLSVRANTDAGATDWDVEYQVPANIVTWTVGEHIDVAYAKTAGGWSPIVSSLTLNFGQAVDVYIGSGGQAADLSDVPLTFRQGSAICLKHDTCGDWSGYDLEVKAPDGWTRIPYGANTDISGYRIIHGGMAEQLSSSSSCADWYVSNVRVAVLRIVN